MVTWARCASREARIAAAKKYLKLARRAQHTRVIADALGQGGLERPADNVLSGILIRAAKGREVVKVGKGTWGLSEWYPKAPKEPAAERQKRSHRSRKASRRAPAAKKDTPQKPAAPKALPAVAASRFSDVALEVVQAAGGPIHATEIIEARECARSHHGAPADRGVPKPSGEGGKATEGRTESLRDGELGPLPASPSSLLSNRATARGRELLRARLGALPTTLPTPCRFLTVHHSRRVRRGLSRRNVHDELSELIHVARSFRPFHAPSMAQRHAPLCRPPFQTEALPARACACLYGPTRLFCEPRGGPLTRCAVSPRQ